MFNANDYLITLVELRSYQSDADTIFTEKERDANRKTGMFRTRK
jgi:hypothetical protein